MGLGPLSWECCLKAETGASRLASVLVVGIGALRQGFELQGWERFVCIMNKFDQLKVNLCKDNVKIMFYMAETSEFVILKFPLKLRKYTDKIVKKTLINGKIVLRIVCPSIDIYFC